MNRFLYIIITIAIIFLPCWIVALVFIDHYNLLMNSPWIYVDSIQSDSPIDDSVIHQEIDDTGSEMESGVNPSNDSQVINATISAYTSSVEETDDTPCISASGVDLCHNIADSMEKYGYDIFIPNFLYVFIIL